MEPPQTGSPGKEQEVLTTIDGASQYRMLEPGTQTRSKKELR
ncbi:hypothetical protein NC651_000721 [Populus alba x Populus x berolinensis]|nr:hypothetical protein NC651_000721 [Populus alba x Populus x berolinensis]